MPNTTAGRNSLLTDGLTNFTHLALFTGDPNAGNEVVGGTYVPVLVAFDPASGGTRISTDAEVLNVPGGNTILFAGLKNGAAGALQSYGGIGTALKKGLASVEADTEVITSKGHGLVNGERVHVWGGMGEALPAGLNVGVAYFVVGVTTDTFQLSLTEGGAAVNVTADGDFYWQQTKPETFGSDGTLSVPDGQAIVDATVI